MDNTIQTNQSFQKYKEILTARHIINQWLSAGGRSSIITSAATSASADQQTSEDSIPIV